ncbi:MAG: glutathione S-transferase family protein [Gammaproteobacteria bacterium]|nr:glutathione S-transferase family protein [Gammaproteobacteria bacterium]
MIYELYYWPGIQGRGEFVRLALEQAGTHYVDVAQDVGGEGTAIEKLERVLDRCGSPYPPYALPVLRAGDLVIAQTANILLYLGPRHGLAPADESGRLWAHQLQLTIMDWVSEIHDTHHPLGPTLHYEDQKAAARKRTTEFLRHRLPKFLGYFETVLERKPTGGGHLVGRALTYVDLSLFQAVDGLRYAFPRAMKKNGETYPLVSALHDRVAKGDRIAAYLASGRRVAFNENGIFRHYPELDAS